MLYEKVPALEQSEAFFIGNAVVLSPLHGTPTVYRLSNGDKIVQSEKSTYSTYLTQTQDYVISEYISATGERYGILLDKTNLA